MKRILALLLGPTLLIVALSASSEGQRGEEPKSLKFKRFPDFGFMPAAKDYEGRVFHLSQDYPKDMPSDDKQPPFMSIDYKTDWRKYMMAVRDYCFEGNIKGGDVEDDFDVAAENPPRWFHMPWQHWTPTGSGREGIHGLTREAQVQPQQLAWGQSATGQTYAVGFFNVFGGYTVGQVWADHERPDPKKALFPNGTVIFKLLFVDIPPAQVPYLANPLQWQAYASTTFTSTTRTTEPLSLIQMDIAVRQPGTPTGWVFGTFQYNGALGKTNRWENLVPVGLIWGNDPEITADDSNPKPVATRINPQLKETVINPDTNELPPTHLGWNGRLNGPVDNPMSSCLSCHMTASAPAAMPLNPLFQPNPPAPGSEVWMQWFQNLKCGEHFDPAKKAHPTDFSLQIAQSIQNWKGWLEEGTTKYAEHYKHAHKRAKALTTRAPKFKLESHSEDEPAEYRIQRDFPEPR
jgi:hypothetical protein